MAWTVPRTWVTGEIVAASQLNEQLRDNSLFLYDGPACRVFRTTDQSIANATWVPITFNSEYYDTDAMHSTVSNTHRVTAVTAARYLLYGCVEFATNSTGNRLIRIARDDGSVVTEASLPPQATVAARLVVVTEFPLAAGQWVALEAYQASGGALNVISAAHYSPILGARRVGSYS